MSTEQASPEFGFYRFKHARRCMQRFQVEQLLPYILDPQGNQPVPPDRPPLTQVKYPIPILQGDLPEGSEPETDSNTVFGIIGAGVTGLYIAMIFEDLGLKYEILEGSDRIGGRLYTHEFRSSKEWNYFDVGAMRFPRIPIMPRVFHLFEQLDITEESGRLLKYCMKSDNEWYHYNTHRAQKKEIDRNPTHDWFKDSDSNNGRVPDDVVKQGMDVLFNESFQPFVDLLARDFEAGWPKLMQYDNYSARVFLSLPILDEDTAIGFLLNKPAYTPSVINWMERMQGATGIFDMALSEVIISQLEFNFPQAPAMELAGGSGPTDPTTGEPQWPWFCVKGGSSEIAYAMERKLSTEVQLSSRVTAITPNDQDRMKPLTVTYGTATGSGRSSSNYSYVISTLPLSALRLVDLDECNLSYAQHEGMRSLGYASSCKVGMKFKTRWWQKLDSGSIKGGQSKTDRIVKTVVFPSYGIDDSGADAVMIASYTFGQDASRVGGLINGRNTDDERILIDNMLKDLAVLHNVSEEFLHQQLETWFAWDWYQNPWSLGAFAHFGPQQFSDIYPAWGQSAAGGRLLFAGEALSPHHGWVEGALISAYDVIVKALSGAGLHDKLQLLKDRWRLPLEGIEEEQNVMDNLLEREELIGAVLSTYSPKQGAEYIQEVQEAIRRLSLAREP